MKTIAGRKLTQTKVVTTQIIPIKLKGRINSKTIEALVVAGFLPIFSQ
jgi:hypothetical protein